jgi:hypothetical protein
MGAPARDIRADAEIVMDFDRNYHRRIEDRNGFA